MPRLARHGLSVAEALLERGEVVALLFAVHEINATLLRIEELLLEDGDEAEEDE